MVAPQNTTAREVQGQRKPRESGRRTGRRRSARAMADGSRRVLPARACEAAERILYVRPWSG